MANTWTAWAQGIAFAAGKNMVSILNGGARVLRVRRIGFINNQTAAVTGVITAGEIRRYTGAGISGHTPITPVSHDTSNSALSSVTVGTLGTPTGTPTVIRRYTWSSDEPAFSAATSDEWECLIPLNIIWDAGYGDANVQPLVLRASEMLTIWNVTGAAGLVDIWIEITDDSA